MEGHGYPPPTRRCILSVTIATEGTPDMRKTLWFPVVLLVLAMVGPAAAAEATYITPDRFDLTKLLAPAPAPDSEQQKRRSRA